MLKMEIKACKRCTEQKSISKYKKSRGWVDKICSSCRYKEQKPNKKKYACDDQRHLNKRYSIYKYHAKVRNLEWAISKEQFKEVTEQECCYCGEFNKYKGMEFEYCGIDRVDSDKGYVIDNCVPCCAYCNQAKSDLTYQQFLDLVKRIYERLIMKGNNLYGKIE
jgi:hypothetical protein